jgi:high-affinity Fe2+/Pb2+ permease
MSRCALTPTPSGPSLGSYDDAMSALYVTLSETRQSDVTVGVRQVEEDQLQQQKEEAQERAAIQQEQANEAGSGGGFLSDVGHFFSDVAGDLVHGRIGSALEDGGRDLEEAWKSPKFWSDLRTGLEDVAMVAGAAAAAVMTAGVGTVAIAGAAAATAAVAGGAAGLAGLRVAHFAATAEDAHANATAAGDNIERLQQLTTDVLADVKQADQSHQHALASLAQSIQTNDRTFVAASSMTVKG